MPARKKHDVIDLLKALRAAGIVCTTVSVGGVTLDGVQWLATEDEKPAKPEPRLSMWERNVEALKQAPANSKDDVPPETLID